MNGEFEFAGAAVNAPAELLLGERCEPALNEIDPRDTRRSEMQVEAWMTGRPPVNCRRLVRARVVEDEMHIGARGDSRLDGGEELTKFTHTLPLVERANRLAALRIEGREQRRGPMPRVVVRVSLRMSGTQRQDGLTAVFGANGRTVCRVTRASMATNPTCLPVIHASTMRGRWASACPVVGRRAQRSSVSTSSSVSVIGFFGRSRRLGVRLVYTENAFGRYLVS